MRASISTRIFLGFTAVIVTFCLVSTYSVFKLHRVHGKLRLIKGGYLRLLLSLNEADAELRSYDVVLDERDPDLLTRSVRVAALLHPFPAFVRRQLGAALRMAGEASRLEEVDPVERDSLLTLRGRLQGVVARMDDFEALSGELYLAVEERDFERAAEIQRRLKQQTRDLRHEVQRLGISLRHDIDASILRAERAETTSFWGVVLLSVVAVVLSVLVTFLAQMTLDPIRRLTEAVKRLREGDEPRTVEIHGQDEVGLLAGEFNRMVATLRERDAELRRTERLATIGRMSAQVAHEVRNPLQSIGLNVELLEEELLELGAAERAEDALAMVRSIQAEAERLNEITEDYLRLARLPNPDLQPEPLDEIVLELLSFVSEVLRRAGVAVTTDLAPDLPAVLADAKQLRQALLNLIRNACEAMEAQGGGEIWLQIQAADDQAVVRLRDSGSGISPEAQPHIFEPFFSTKKEGTGLGLALTRSIVEAHGGRIACSSQPGGGTEFVLHLPLATSKEA